MQNSTPIDSTAVSRLLNGTNLYLIGMMGSGKTTVGKVLAKRLGYQFFDTDAVIEKAAGQAITEIFATSGEDAFRELETNVLSQLSPYKNLAIATGGGIVLRRKNWSYLHHGVTVWLDVPVEHLYKRLKGSTNRPLLHDPDPLTKLRQILEQRQSLYVQADIRIPILHHENSDEVADRVLEALNQAIATKLAESPKPIGDKN
ncbi:MAG TPA: shikimate kinase [Crinalium sp.]|jgi:shikimate kinase